MSTIPQFLIGSGVAATITPLTVAADGSYTLGTATTMAGTWDVMDQGSSFISEAIQGADMPMINNIVTGETFSVSITGITPTTGATLADLAYAYSYFQVTFARSGKTFTFIGVLDGYQEPYARGKNTGTMTFKSCGIAPTLA